MEWDFHHPNWLWSRTIRIQQVTQIVLIHGLNPRMNQSFFHRQAAKEDKFSDLKKLNYLYSLGALGELAVKIIPLQAGFLKQESLV